MTGTAWELVTDRWMMLSPVHPDHPPPEIQVKDRVLDVAAMCLLLQQRIAEDLRHKQVLPAGRGPYFRPSDQEDH